MQIAAQILPSMSDYFALGILGFDHVEFAVADLEKVSPLFLRMGFEKAAVRELKDRNLRSVLFSQNQITVVLTQSTSLGPQKTDSISKFVEAHGDGLYQITFRCKDAMTAFELAVQRGALMADGPKTISRDFGQVHFASIKAFGDVRHGFISREGSLFSEGFELPFRSQNEGGGLTEIDHIGSVIPQANLADWLQFYQQVFGLKASPLVADGPESPKALESPDGAIKMTFNQSLIAANQVQDFLDVNHGAGVQHLALASTEMAQSLQKLKKGGVALLTTADNPQNALAQVYSQNVIGPFFFEFIQRNSGVGFGTPVTANA